VETASADAACSAASRRCRRCCSAVVPCDQMHESSNVSENYQEVALRFACSAAAVPPALPLATAVAAAAPPRPVQAKPNPKP